MVFGLNPAWFAGGLFVVTCLLIGARANLIVGGFADRAGYPIRFVPCLLMAFPLMILSILTCSVYVYLRYL